MTFYIRPETEARLLAKAQEEGMSIDSLLDQLMNESEPISAARTDQIPELPQWHLGARGTLRRCEIYDDVH